MFNEIGIIHVVFLAALVITLYRVRKTLSGSGLRARHERHLSPRASARWHRVLLLEFIELTLAGVFLFVGGAKLIGRPDMVALFRDIGVGQWFRYVTGTVEVAGAALLIVPFLSGASAVLLGGVMIAATLIEFFVLHRPPVAAMACLGGHSFVAWARISKRHLFWLHGDSVVHHRKAASSDDIRSRWRFKRARLGRGRPLPDRSSRSPGIKPLAGGSWMDNPATYATPKESPFR